MVKLEDIRKDAQIRGITAVGVVRVSMVDRIGDHAITVIYKDAEGRLSEQMLFRTDESRLEMAQSGRSWSFQADGAKFKLGLEAYRISQAAMFDPMMAVNTSNVDPLPHQISAVYEAMLPKQPLRFVLADDPGAGKTIMAGLLIRELLMRADAQRVLIVAPGSLSEQWQDEMLEKFGVQFEIFSREKQDQSANRNFFAENDLLICRLDQLSRSEDLQAQLKQTEWDLIIVDEAHKLSANYFGQKVNKTKRFELGELLGSITRHFLLMTATPHNGKEEDYQIWLSLLDADRFYGKFREGVHKVDVKDMMRRMVKEDLLKFDGTKLFPERRAYTANYELSDLEGALYAEVTDYVRNEMNRAEFLDGQKKGNIGFALTMLQRRLASSPEAIYQSLNRRKKRLEARLEEIKLVSRGHKIRETLAEYTTTKKIDLPENLDEIEDELSAEEYEQYTDTVVDGATAAATIPELEAEISTLQYLVQKAIEVVQSGSDTKWDQLSYLIQESPEMRTASGARRKLIIFTEHRDTLNYLVTRISDMLGKPEAVVTISGGTNRDERRKVQEQFRNNPDVLVLIATDAAGEGVNLQNTNLMVNYDLPWNPNRLEQRFGRIHRIGQREVCHLWNLVANGTREGEVFKRLFDKMEIAKAALGGKVFDVLGEAFDNVSLKNLLIDAIRYGDDPKIRQKMEQVFADALDTDNLIKIMERNALVENQMGLDQLYAVKEEMEKAEARKMQPYFIESFFKEAFALLTGELKPREKGRFEITRVPSIIIEHDRVVSESRTPVLQKYERVCFEKQNIHVHGKPMASLLHPAHPLMHATTDKTLLNFRGLLKQGSVLLDPNDEGLEPRVLFMIDHTVRESEQSKKEVASRRLQFVEIDQYGKATFAGWAPHLDLVPMNASEKALVADVLEQEWINNDLDNLAIAYASEYIVPDHYQEVKSRRELQVNKTLTAVHERLVKEINYLSGQAIKLDEGVQAGRQPRVNPDNMRRKAEELTARLERRTSELEAMRNVVSSTPVVIGGALIIPQGLIDQRKGLAVNTFSVDAEARSRIERIAMQVVIATEQSFGHQTFDRSAEKCGWDVTSRPPALADGSINQDRHIEVKGRVKGADTVTITKNEIFSSYNQGEKYILAIVIVDGENHEGPFYIKHPFKSEPEFGVASVNYSLSDLLSRSIHPKSSLN